MHLAHVVSVAFVGLVMPSLAWADSLENRPLAELLFREGRQLMDNGNVPEGCRKLEESQRLEAAPGTLLALASCHEREGRTATALAEFLDARLAAQRSGRKDRESYATAHIEALEPVVPRLVVEVPASSQLPSMALQRNGADLPKTAWGMAIPADPGPVTIVVRAPGYRPWSTSVLSATSTTLRVSVPLLFPDKPTPSAPPTPTKSFADAPTVAKPRLGAAWAFTGLSAAAFGTGTYLGLRTLALRRESDEACPDVQGERRCTEAGVDANERARRHAWMTDVAMGVGVASLGAALYFFVSRPSPAKTSPTHAIQLGPDVTPQGAGARLQGTW